jgi:DNA-directed RNA polymerase specialized sigma24 family protein
VKRRDDRTGGRRLVARCVAGDADAVRRFQEAYGELVYGFPIRAYRVPADEAGDFYVFAFEGGRLFRRMRTFEGRTSLRAYLLGCVLDNLVLEWKRGLRDIDSVPLESIKEVGGAAEDSTAQQRAALAQLLDPLDAEKALLVKLLYIEDFDFEPGDVRLLARLSRRPVRDVLAGIERLRRIVREREARLKETEDALDSVQGWMRLYDRRLRELREGIEAEMQQAGAERLSSLQQERAELERKYQWRKRQRAGLLTRAQRRKVTAPYKEIAGLLNTSVGTLGSRIKRLREELAQSGFSD